MLFVRGKLDHPSTPMAPPYDSALTTTWNRRLRRVDIPAIRIVTSANLRARQH